MIKRNLLILGLIVSVGFNLFLLGAIGIRLNAMQEIADARPFPPNIGWIVRDLSDERQAELADVLQPLGDEIFPLRRAMFAAQRRVNELMAASEYDEQALRDAFARLRSAAEAYTALSHQQTLTVLGHLSAEERRVAMEFVQRRGPRDGRDGFRGPGRAGDGFRSPQNPGGRPGPGRPPSTSTPPDQ